MLRAPIALAVALLALLLSGAVIGAVGEAERTPAATDTLPEGYDSTTVAELSQELPRGEGSVAVALFTSDSGTLDRATRGQLTEVYADLVARSTDKRALARVIDTIADLVQELGYEPRIDPED